MTLLRKGKKKSFIYQVINVTGAHGVIFYKVTLTFLLRKLQYIHIFFGNYESMASQNWGADMGFLGFSRHGIRRPEMGEEEVIRSACCGGTRRSTYQFLPTGVGGTKRTHPLTNTDTEAKAKNPTFFSFVSADGRWRRGRDQVSFVYSTQFNSHLQRKSHYVCLFWESRCLSPSFHIHVSVRYLIHSQDRSTYFLQRNRQIDHGNI
jgi:hypothetical protein